MRIDNSKKYVGKWQRKMSFFLHTFLLLYRFKIDMSQVY